MTNGDQPPWPFNLSLMQLAPFITLSIWHGWFGASWPLITKPETSPQGHYELQRGPQSRFVWLHVQRGWAGFFVRRHFQRHISGYAPLDAQSLSQSPANRGLGVSPQVVCMAAITLVLALSRPPLRWRQRFFGCCPPTWKGGGSGTVAPVSVQNNTWRFILSGPSCLKTSWIFHGYL